MPNEYISIHRKLFTGIYFHEGCLRDYNITKKEWVLNGATVLYGSATELRATLGFDVKNDIFAENAWYFRNSLVRANDNDLKNDIYETAEYLEVFLRNFLLNENHPLHNRTLHISATIRETEKPDIETAKPDIDEIKADIEKKFQSKTASHILRLREAFSGQTVFGRSDVMSVLDIKPSRASELLKELAEHGIIEPVSGYGKGKYRFRQQAD